MTKKEKMNARLMAETAINMFRESLKKELIDDLDYTKTLLADPARNHDKVMLMIELINKYIKLIETHRP